jgi:Putative addiction module component
VDRPELDLKVVGASVRFMPSVSLPLDRMTVSQKMKVLEQVWESLREQEGRFESRAWHADVLTDRRRLVEAGKAKFSPWKEAKARIRRRVHGSRSA